MTPESIPELDTRAFRRAMAAALGLPAEGEPPRHAARRPAAAWDPLGSVEVETETTDDAPRHDAAPQRRAA